MKINMYSYINEQARELMRGENNFIANASNITALLFTSLKDINWAGFYFSTSSIIPVKINVIPSNASVIPSTSSVIPEKAGTYNELVLGPFMGNPACIRINIGSGVCGKAFESEKAIIVPDVHKFPGHIACDPDSNSEIVVPMKYNDKIFGVVDVDSPVSDRFSEEEQRLLEDIAEILIEQSDVDKLINYYH